MRRKIMLVSVTIPATLAVLACQAASSPQDPKYSLQIPNGLAFSEFEGYESWQTIAVSHNGDKLAAILGNPVMINAYKAGIPGNGKPFPDGAKMAKVHWNATVNAGEPGAPQGNDAKCGFACHTAVKSKDYVFTDYGGMTGRGRAAHPSCSHFARRARN